MVITIDEESVIPSVIIDQSDISDMIDIASDNFSNILRAEDLESVISKGNVTDREVIKPGRKNGKNSSQNSKKDGQSS